MRGMSIGVRAKYYTGQNVIPHSPILNMFEVLIENICNDPKAWDEYQPKM